MDTLPVPDPSIAETLTNILELADVGVIVAVNGDDVIELEVVVNLSP